MKSGEVLLKVIEDSLEWERVNGEVIVISPETIDRIAPLLAPIL